jgi:F-type H+-transporting ATPase subunit a
MLKMGPIKFWTGQVPHMELPAALAIVLKPMIFVLEIIGLFIRHAVLAVRLLANMMAGHLVLAVIMAFIAAAATNALVWYGVAPMSILGATALSMLELFVAFLQAYIFTFLSALFIGMAVHPH